MEFEKLANRVLHEIATQFDNRKKKTSEGCGWGQFLDGPSDHTQVGPYGTSSGIITISLARGLDATVTAAADDLVEQWSRFKEAKKNERGLFCQNPRLAWLYLALSLSGAKNNADADDVRRVLMRRRISEDQWGDWWINDSDHDTTPRGFTTALVYFCLTYQSKPTKESKIWANKQTPLPLTFYGFPTIEVIFHALAVLKNLDCPSAEAKFRRELKKQPWRSLVDSRELAVYFYDYCFLDSDDSLGHSREYFIVPIRLIGILLGASAVAPPLLKAAAMSSASQVITSMRAQQGGYREAEGSRASSLNQAWAAMAISEAKKLIAPRRGKLVWHLVRERHSRFVDDIFPFLAVGAATLLVAFSPDSALSKGVGALCLLAMGWVYADKINRILKRV